VAVSSFHFNRHKQSIALRDVILAGRVGISFWSQYQQKVSQRS